MVRTLVLGVVFLATQGVEWGRLLSHGWTVSTNLYSGLFYLVVGAHAAHVCVGLALLAWLLARLRRGGWGEPEKIHGMLAGMFWGFVVLVWPGLYFVVYS